MFWAVMLSSASSTLSDTGALFWQFGSNSTAFNVLGQSEPACWHHFGTTSRHVLLCTKIETGIAESTDLAIAIKERRAQGRRRKQQNAPARARAFRDMLRRAGGLVPILVFLLF